MNLSMIASKYELIIAKRDKTIAELKYTNSENNEFFTDQMRKLNLNNAKLNEELMVLKEKVRDLTLNKSRRVS